MIDEKDLDEFVPVGPDNRDKPRGGNNEYQDRVKVMPLLPIAAPAAALPPIIAADFFFERFFTT